MSSRLTQAGTALFCALWLATGCVGGGGADPGGTFSRGPVVINELMSDNDASWVDDHLETTDYIELTNITAKSVSLKGYALRDGNGKRGVLPPLELAAGGHVVLFADGQLEQGAMHLPWKLDSDGELLELLDASGTVIERIELPALELNQSYARFPDGTGALKACRYSTPERDNGKQCEPPAPPSPPDDSTWQAFTWPSPAQPNAPKGPLVLTELALLPASFVEVLNVSDETITLAAYALQLDPTAPGIDWPKRNDSPALRWGQTTLAPRARVSLPLTAADVRAIADNDAFEGVATLFDAHGKTIDRVDFMRWPSGAQLTRIPDADGPLRFCKTASRGQPNDVCDPLASRPVGDRLRHLYTPGDFEALAAGDTQLGAKGVKYVVDMQAGDAVHLLGTRAWALHYTWIREKIDHEPPLNRCDPAQAAAFADGWKAFSNAQYAALANRRYLLGNLDVYAGSGVKTVDFVYGDQISAAFMWRAFYAAMGHIDAEDPHDWSVHPNEARQVTELRKIEGNLPIISRNEPFRALRYQPLTPGIAYGVLERVPSDELADAVLGPHSILVTDGVPNDIPFVAGLITEAFQTPLAHVNVLSQNRGTPNMGLRDAFHSKELAPLFGKLVELRVDGSSFSVQASTPEAADAFWTSREPKGEKVKPHLDLTLRGVVDLRGRGLEDLPAIGAKAAQLAEVGKIRSDARCPVLMPDFPFAIPLAHYAEHFKKSGAAALLQQLIADAKFRGDVAVREKGLARLRDLITKTPLDPQLLAQVETAIRTRYGTRHVRFRSSSNTEDLPGFNGAGLYVSVNGQLDDPKNRIDDAIRTVWASLWSTRAYDEREYSHIDQTGVAMGVLVHPAFLSEKANVIAISRDALDPERADLHYMNAQLGEASVALPAPGVATEEILYHLPTGAASPELSYVSESSISHGQHVLSLQDARGVSCLLSAIHTHFQTLLDPAHENRWFAMDVELKIVGEGRGVFVKQARPYSFARPEVPTDCREL